ncbi:PHP domain-containing protein [bacterium]|nr:PHP domain-containing protein [bacterium]
MDQRVEFHLHTKMSRLDSIVEPEEVFKACKRKELLSFAVTDHAVINAFPEIKRLSEKFSLPVIYGIESFVVNDIDRVEQIVEENKDYSKKDLDYKHVIILAKNSEGLKDLNSIVSKSHTEYFYKVPLLPLKLLDRIRKKGNILTGSACEAGEIVSAILKNEKKEIIYSLAQKYDFLEIQPLSNSTFMIELGRVKDEEAIRDINRYVYQMSKDLGIPCIATSDAHMVDREDNQIRHVILKKLGYWDFCKAAPLPILSTTEMLEEFLYLGEKSCREVVLDNSLRLYDKIEKNIEPQLLQKAGNAELHLSFLEFIEQEPVEFIKNLSMGMSEALKKLKDFEYHNSPAIAVFSSKFEYFDFVTSKKMVETYFNAIEEKPAVEKLDFLTLAISKLVVANRIDPDGAITILNDFDSTDFLPVQYPDDKINPELLISHFNSL